MLYLYAYSRYTQDRLHYYIRRLHAHEADMPQKSRQELIKAAREMAQSLFKSIPNSRLLSTRCERCRQRTRVTIKTAAENLYNHKHRILCNECDPNPLCDKGVFLTERQREVLGKTRS